MTPLKPLKAQKNPSNPSSEPRIICYLRQSAILPPFPILTSESSSSSMFDILPFGPIFCYIYNTCC